MREMRKGRPAGLSRRTLIRRSIGAAVGLWLLEVTGGLLGFLWPNLSRGFGGSITLGDMRDRVRQPGRSGRDALGGCAGVLLAGPHLRPADRCRRAASPTGRAPTAEGENTNVRTLYQRCPHLGCKPNFCTTNYWFECPCHGSRYDRLGTKVQELGPAPRSLDRFAHTVESGVLTVDTSRLTLGPLPVALGQPGLIPARSPTGLRVTERVEPVAS